MLPNYWKSWQNFGHTIGLSDRTIYDTYVQVSDIPGVGNFLKTSDRQRSMADYMANRGIDYGNVKYPTLTVGGTDSSVSGAMYLSKTLFSLY